MVLKRDDVQLMLDCLDANDLDIVMRQLHRISTLLANTDSIDSVAIDDSQRLSRTANGIYRKVAGTLIENEAAYRKRCEQQAERRKNKQNQKSGLYRTPSG